MTSPLGISFFVLLLSLIALAEVFGLEFTVGNEEHPWEEWGGEAVHSRGPAGQEVPDYLQDWVGRGFQSGENIIAMLDVITQPGWIQPVRTDSSINLSPGLQERGGKWGGGHYGGADVPLTEVIDGDPTTMVGNPVGLRWQWHTTYYLDLGGAFPVHRIRFYTRPGAELFLMKGYVLRVNDGDPATFDFEGKTLGATIKEWDIIAEVPVNEEADVDLRFPLQYVRYVSLGDEIIEEGRKTRWEFAEIEIYGEGYVKSVMYTSKVIEFEKPVNWGHLRWHAEIDPGATLILRTRSGKTPDPYLYYVKTGIGPTGVTEVSRAEYIATLKDPSRQVLADAVIGDADNWSVWSTPYALTGDEGIVSPGPARYFQFELSFERSAPFARAKVDSLAIQYTAPVARELVGEIAYDMARIIPGQLTEFQYAIGAHFQGDETGFDAIQIKTPEKVDVRSIGDLKINHLEVEPDSIQVMDDRFTVYLPEKIAPRSSPDSALVELAFSTRVYVHGTRLLGYAFDSEDPEALPQPILSGDATEDIDTDDLQVVWWPLGGSLLGSVELFPNPFTPNGDGVNDQTEISYVLLQVDTEVPVSLSIYDLSGERVYSLRRVEKSGRKTIAWGGRDDEGTLVPPGLYLWRIMADTASGQYVSSGTLAVVY